MNIATPRQRKPSNWEKNKSIVSKFCIDKIDNKTPVTIKQYCEFSEQILDAPHEFFSETPKKYLEWLQKPNISYQTGERSANQQRKNQAKQQGERIIGIISYAWDFLIRLMKGKTENGNNDTLGVYNEENINLEMARIQNMLNQIKGKNYRSDLFSRENAFDQQQQQEEINEEITFIKLLQNILRTQMKKIKQNRQNFVPQERVPQERRQVVQEKSEPIPKISEIIKVEDYFQRKMERLQAEKNQQEIKDPLTKQQQQRKFNLAAIRYYMPTTKGK